MRKATNTAAFNPRDLEITPDDWLYVITDSPEAARRFFGVGPECPVELHCREARGTVFKVWAGELPGEVEAERAASRVEDRDEELKADLARLIGHAPQAIHR